MTEAPAGTWCPLKWGDRQRGGHPLEEQLQGLVLAPQTVVVSAGACLYASSLHNLQLHHKGKAGQVPWEQGHSSNLQPVQSLVLLLVVMCEEKRETHAQWSRILCYVGCG